MPEELIRIDLTEMSELRDLVQSLRGIKDVFLTFSKAVSTPSGGKATVGEISIKNLIKKFDQEFSAFTKKFGEGAKEFKVKGIDEARRKIQGFSGSIGKMVQAVGEIDKSIKSITAASLKLKKSPELKKARDTLEKELNNIFTKYMSLNVDDVIRTAEKTGKKLNDYFKTINDRLAETGKGIEKQIQDLPKPKAKVTKGSQGVVGKAKEGIKKIEEKEQTYISELDERVTGTLDVLHKRSIDQIDALIKEVRGTTPAGATARFAEAGRTGVLKTISAIKKGIQISQKGLTKLVDKALNLQKLNEVIGRSTKQVQRLENEIKNIERTIQPEEAEGIIARRERWITALNNQIKKFTEARTTVWNEISKKLSSAAIGDVKEFAKLLETINDIRFYSRLTRRLERRGISPESLNRVRTTFGAFEFEGKFYENINLITKGLIATAKTSVEEVGFAISEQIGQYGKTVTKLRLGFTRGRAPREMFKVTEAISGITRGLGGLPGAKFGKVSAGAKEDVVGKLLNSIAMQVAQRAKSEVSVSGMAVSGLDVEKAADEIATAIITPFSGYLLAKRPEIGKAVIPSGRPDLMKLDDLARYMVREAMPTAMRKKFQVTISKFFEQAGDIGRIKTEFMRVMGMVGPAETAGASYEGYIREMEAQAKLFIDQQEYTREFAPTIQAAIDAYISGGSQVFERVVNLLKIRTQKFLVEIIKLIQNRVQLPIAEAMAKYRKEVQQRFVEMLVAGFRKEQGKVQKLASGRAMQSGLISGASATEEQWTAPSAFSITTPGQTPKIERELRSMIFNLMSYSLRGKSLKGTRFISDFVPKILKETEAAEVGMPGKQLITTQALIERIKTSKGEDAEQAKRLIEQVTVLPEEEFKRFKFIAETLKLYITKKGEFTKRGQEMMKRVMGNARRLTRGGGISTQYQSFLKVMFEEVLNIERESVFAQMIDPAQMEAFLSHEKVASQKLVANIVSRIERFPKGKMKTGLLTYADMKERQRKIAEEKLKRVGDIIKKYTAIGFSPTLIRRLIATTEKEQEVFDREVVALENVIKRGGAVAYEYFPTQQIVEKHRQEALAIRGLEEAENVSNKRLQRAFQKISKVFQEGAGFKEIRQMISDVYKRGDRETVSRYDKAITALSSIHKENIQNVGKILIPAIVQFFVGDMENLEQVLRTLALISGGAATAERYGNIRSLVGEFLGISRKEYGRLDKSLKSGNKQAVKAVRDRLVTLFTPKIMDLGKSLEDFYIQMSADLANLVTTNLVSWFTAQKEGLGKTFGAIAMRVRQLGRMRVKGETIGMIEPSGFLPGTTGEIPIETIRQEQRLLGARGRKPTGEVPVSYAPAVKGLDDILRELTEEFKLTKEAVSVLRAFMETKFSGREVVAIRGRAGVTTPGRGGPSAFGAFAGKDIEYGLQNIVKDYMKRLGYTVEGKAATTGTKIHDILEGVFLEYSKRIGTQMVTEQPVTTVGTREGAAAKTSLLGFGRIDILGIFKGYGEIFKALGAMPALVDIKTVTRLEAFDAEGFKTQISAYVEMFKVLVKMNPDKYPELQDALKLMGGREVTAVRNSIVNIQSIVKDITQLQAAALVIDREAFEAAIKKAGFKSIDQLRFLVLAGKITNEQVKRLITIVNQVGKVEVFGLKDLPDIERLMIPAYRAIVAFEQVNKVLGNISGEITKRFVEYKGRRVEHIDEALLAKNLRELGLPFIKDAEKLKRVAKEQKVSMGEVKDAIKRATVTVTSQVPEREFKDFYAQLKERLLTQLKTLTGFSNIKQYLGEYIGRQQIGGRAGVAALPAPGRVGVEKERVQVSAETAKMTGEEAKAYGNIIGSVETLTGKLKEKTGALEAEMAILKEEATIFVSITQTAESLVKYLRGTEKLSSVIKSASQVLSLFGLSEKEVGKVVKNLGKTVGKMEELKSATSKVKDTVEGTAQGFDRVNKSATDSSKTIDDMLGGMFNLGSGTASVEEKIKSMTSEAGRYATMMNSAVTFSKNESANREQIKAKLSDALSHIEKYEQLANRLSEHSKNNVDAAKAEFTARQRIAQIYERASEFGLRTESELAEKIDLRNKKQRDLSRQANEYFTQLGRIRTASADANIPLHERLESLREAIRALNQYADVVKSLSQVEGEGLATASRRQQFAMRRSQIGEALGGLQAEFKRGADPAGELTRHIGKQISQFNEEMLLSGRAYAQLTKESGGAIRENLNVIRKVTDQQGKQLLMVEGIATAQGKVTTQVKETASVYAGTVANQMKNIMARLAKWGSGAFLYFGVMRGARDAVRAITEMESAITSLRQVMNQSNTDFMAMSEQAYALAVSYATPIKDLMKTMLEFARQGLNQEEVIEASRVATLAANVTVLNATLAMDTLTAATRQYNISAMDSIKVLDAWNLVANRNAVTAKDLGGAMKQAGSIAKLMGLGFEELTGIMAALQETTRRGGPTIGRAIRFMLVHLRTDETEKALTDLGISIRKTAGEYRTASSVFKEVAERWRELTSAQKYQVSYAIGHVRFGAFVAAMFENWAKVTKATTEATYAHGSAMAENEIAMQAFKKQVTGLRNEWEAFIYSFGRTGILGILRGFLSIGKGILGVFDKLPGVIKTTISVLGTSAVLFMGLSRFLRWYFSIDLSDVIRRWGLRAAGKEAAKTIGFLKNVSSVAIGKNISETETLAMAQNTVTGSVQGTNVLYTTSLGLLNSMTLATRELAVAQGLVTGGTTKVAMQTLPSTLVMQRGRLAPTSARTIKESVAVAGTGAAVKRSLFQKSTFRETFRAARVSGKATGNRWGNAFMAATWLRVKGLGKGSFWKGLGLALTKVGGTLAGFLTSPLGIVAAAIAGTTAALWGFRKVTDNTSKIIIEKNKKLINELQQSLNEAKIAIVSYTTALENIATGARVDLSAIEREKKLRSDIASRFPGLVKGYTDYGDAILESSNRVGVLKKRMEELATVKAVELIGIQLEEVSVILRDLSDPRVGRNILTYLPASLGLLDSTIDKLRKNIKEYNNLREAYNEAFKRGYDVTTIRKNMGEIAEEIREGTKVVNTSFIQAENRMRSIAKMGGTAAVEAIGRALQTNSSNLEIYITSIVQSLGTEDVLKGFRAFFVKTFGPDLGTIIKDSVRNIPLPALKESAEAISKAISDSLLTNIDVKGSTRKAVRKIVKDLEDAIRGEDYQEALLSAMEGIYEIRGKLSDNAVQKLTSKMGEFAIVFAKKIEGDAKEHRKMFIKTTEGYAIIDEEAIANIFGGKDIDLELIKKKKEFIMKYKKSGDVIDMIEEMQREKGKWEGDTYVIKVGIKPDEVYFNKLKVAMDAVKGYSAYLKVMDQYLTGISATEKNRVSMMKDAYSIGTKSAKEYANILDALEIKIKKNLSRFGGLMGAGPEFKREMLDITRLRAEAELTVNKYNQWRSLKNRMLADPAAFQKDTHAVRTFKNLIGDIQASYKTLPREAQEMYRGVFKDIDKVLIDEDQVEKNKEKILGAIRDIADKAKYKGVLTFETIDTRVFDKAIDEIYKKFRDTSALTSKDVESIINKIPIDTGAVINAEIDNMRKKINTMKKEQFPGLFGTISESDINYFKQLNTLYGELEKKRRTAKVLGKALPFIPKKTDLDAVSKSLDSLIKEHGARLASGVSVDISKSVLPRLKKELEAVQLMKMEFKLDEAQAAKQAVGAAELFKSAFTRELHERVGEEAGGKLALGTVKGLQRGLTVLGGTNFYRLLAGTMKIDKVANQLIRSGQKAFEKASRGRGGTDTMTAILGLTQQNIGEALRTANLGGVAINAASQIWDEYLSRARDGSTESIAVFTETIKAFSKAAGNTTGEMLDNITKQMEEGMRPDVAFMDMVKSLGLAPEDLRLIQQQSTKMLSTITAIQKGMGDAASDYSKSLTESGKKSRLEIVSLLSESLNIAKYYEKRRDEAIKDMKEYVTTLVSYSKELTSGVGVSFAEFSEKMGGHLGGIRKMLNIFSKSTEAEVRGWAKALKEILGRKFVEAFTGFNIQAIKQSINAIRDALATEEFEETGYAGMTALASQIKKLGIALAKTAIKFPEVKTWGKMVKEAFDKKTVAEAEAMGKALIKLGNETDELRKRRDYLKKGPPAGAKVIFFDPASVNELDEQIKQNEIRYTRLKTQLVAGSTAMKSYFEDTSKEFNELFRVLGYTDKQIKVSDKNLQALGLTGIRAAYAVIQQQISWIKMNKSLSDFVTVADLYTDIGLVNRIGELTPVISATEEVLTALKKEYISNTEKLREYTEQTEDFIKVQERQKIIVETVKDVENWRERLVGFESMRSSYSDLNKSLNLLDAQTKVYQSSLDSVSKTADYFKTTIDKLIESSLRSGEWGWDKVPPLIKSSISQLESYYSELLALQRQQDVIYNQVDRLGDAWVDALHAPDEEQTLLKSITDSFKQLRRDASRNFIQPVLDDWKNLFAGTVPIKDIQVDASAEIKFIVAEIKRLEENIRSEKGVFEEVFLGDLKKALGILNENDTIQALNSMSKVINNILLGKGGVVSAPVPLKKASGVVLTAAQGVVDGRSGGQLGHAVAKEGSVLAELHPGEIVVPARLAGGVPSYITNQLPVYDGFSSGIRMAEGGVLTEEENLKKAKQVADSLFNKGLFLEAVSAYRGILKVRPNDRDVNLNLNRLLSQNAFSDPSIKLEREKDIAKHPEIEEKIKEANLLYRSQEYKKALDIFTGIRFKYKDIEQDSKWLTYGFIERIKTFIEYNKPGDVAGLIKEKPELGKALDPRDMNLEDVELLARSSSSKKELKSILSEIPLDNHNVRLGMESLIKEKSYFYKLFERLKKWGAVRSEVSFAKEMMKSLNKEAVVDYLGIEKFKRYFPKIPITSKQFASGIRMVEGGQLPLPRAAVRGRFTQEEKEKQAENRWKVMAKIASAAWKLGGKGVTGFMGLISSALKKEITLPEMNNQLTKDQLEMRDAIMRGFGGKYKTADTKTDLNFWKDVYRGLGIMGKGLSTGWKGFIKFIKDHMSLKEIYLGARAQQGQPTALDIAAGRASGLRLSEGGQLGHAVAAAGEVAATLHPGEIVVPAHLAGGVPYNIVNKLPVYDGFSSGVRMQGGGSIGGVTEVKSELDKSFAKLVIGFKAAALNMEVSDKVFRQNLEAQRSTNRSMEDVGRNMEVVSKGYKKRAAVSASPEDSRSSAIRIDTDSMVSKGSVGGGGASLEIGMVKATDVIKGFNTILSKQEDKVKELTDAYTKLKQETGDLKTASKEAKEALAKADWEKAINQVGLGLLHATEFVAKKAEPVLVGGFQAIVAGMSGSAEVLAMAREKLGVEMGKREKQVREELAGKAVKKEEKKQVTRRATEITETIGIQKASGIKMHLGKAEGERKDISLSAEDMVKTVMLSTEDYANALSNLRDPDTVDALNALQIQMIGVSDKAYKTAEAELVNAKAKKEAETATQKASEKQLEAAKKSDAFGKAMGTVIATLEVGIGQQMMKDFKTLAEDISLTIGGITLQGTGKTTGTRMKEAGLEDFQMKTAADRPEVQESVSGGGAVGAVVGKQLGTTAGAALGAALGGPAGAKIGAAIGDVAGDILGSVVGSWLGELFAPKETEEEKQKREIESAINSAKLFGSALDSLSSVTALATESMSVVFDDMKGKIGEAITSFGRGLEDGKLLISTFGKEYIKTTDNVKDAAGNITQFGTVDIDYDKIKSDYEDLSVQINEASSAAQFSAEGFKKAAATGGEASFVSEEGEETGLYDLLIDITDQMSESFDLLDSQAIKTSATLNLFGGVMTAAGGNVKEAGRAMMGMVVEGYKVVEVFKDMGEGGGKKLNFDALLGPTMAEIGAMMADSELIGAQRDASNAMRDLYTEQAGVEAKQDVKEDKSFLFWKWKGKEDDPIKVAERNKAILDAQKNAAASASEAAALDKKIADLKKEVEKKTQEAISKMDEYAKTINDLMTTGVASREAWGMVGSMFQSMGGLASEFDMLADAFGQAGQDIGGLFSGVGVAGGLSLLPEGDVNRASKILTSSTQEGLNQYNKIIKGQADNFAKSSDKLVSSTGDMLALSAEQVSTLLGVSQEVAQQLAGMSLREIYQEYRNFLQGEAQKSVELQRKELDMLANVTVTGFDSIMFTHQDYLQAMSDTLSQWAADNDLIKQGIGEAIDKFSTTAEYIAKDVFATSISGLGSDLAGIFDVFGNAPKESLQLFTETGRGQLEVSGAAKEFYGEQLKLMSDQIQAIKDMQLANVAGMHSLASEVGTAVVGQGPAVAAAMGRLTSATTFGSATYGEALIAEDLAILEEAIQSGNLSQDEQLRLQGRLFSLNSDIAKTNLDISQKESELINLGQESNDLLNRQIDAYQKEFGKPGLEKEFIQRNMEFLRNMQQSINRATGGVFTTETGDISRISEAEWVALQGVGEGQFQIAQTLEEFEKLYGQKIDRGPKEVATYATVRPITNNIDIRIDADFIDPSQLDADRQRSLALMVKDALIEEGFRYSTD